MEDNLRTQVDFHAPATLRKWPSTNGKRRSAGTGPYLVLESTLIDCIERLLAKPPAARQLYEVHTSPQAPLLDNVVTSAKAAELADLRDFHA